MLYIYVRELVILSISLAIFSIDSSESITSRRSAAHSSWPDTVNHWLQQYELMRPSNPMGFESNSVDRYKSFEGQQFRGPLRASYHHYPNQLQDLYPQAAAADSSATDAFEERAILESQLKHRFDQDEKHHGKIESHEFKEVSYVYPVLLALLILGALFVPFLSLFFFLSVTAFNCNSFGSGLQSVAPVFGRRRKRRSVGSVTTSMQDPHFKLDSTSQDRARGAREGYTDRQGDRNNSTANRRSNGRVDPIKSTNRLAQFVLWDEMADDVRGGNSFVEFDSYDYWHRQLASSTAKLLDALLEFGEWIGVDQ